MGWPQQPPTEKVLKFKMVQNGQNIKIKLKSKTWMTLNSSLVILQARTSAASLASSASSASMASTTSEALFNQKTS